MALTDDAMAILPAFVGEADTRNGNALRTWLSGLLDQVQPTADLLDDPTVLAVPSVCPRAMLPFAAALAGIDTVRIPDASLRSWIAGMAGQGRGSEASLKARIQTTLTGAKYVAFEWFYQGYPWRVRITTHTSETPDTAATAFAAGREAPAWRAITMRTT